MLPAVVEAQDEPFGSTSIVAQWFVMREARAGRLKVMLDGQGGDETLAGYLDDVRRTGSPTWLAHGSLVALRHELRRSGSAAAARPPSRSSTPFLPRSCAGGSGPAGRGRTASSTGAAQDGGATCRRRRRRRFPTGFDGSTT